MITAGGEWGSWEIDPNEKRLRWLGLHEHIDLNAMPRKLRNHLNDDGMPTCEAERTGEDGWAPYHAIVNCAVGEAFVVRWLDGGVMHVPTRLTTVEES